MIALVRDVPTRDEVFEYRCRLLMDQLAVAQDEMASALLAGDLELAAAAARKLASIGWLLREAADKRDRARGAA